MNACITGPTPHQARIDPIASVRRLSALTIPRAPVVIGSTSERPKLLIMKPVILRFRSEDVESAAKVLLRFTPRQPPMDRLREFLTLDSHYFVAASMDGSSAGWAYACELPRPNGQSMLFLYSIEVAAEYRRQGVATAMLSYLRRVADEHRMKELFVIANRSNVAAVALYKATGGVVEGEELCFVYPTKESASTA